MKIMNLIIVATFSLCLVACGGGWEQADKDAYLKNCKGDSKDETLGKLCDCNLGVAEANFDNLAAMTPAEPKEGEEGFLHTNEIAFV